MNRWLIAFALLSALAACDRASSYGEATSQPPVQASRVSQDLWGSSFESVSVTEGGEPSSLPGATPVSLRLERRENEDVVMWAGCRFWGAEVRVGAGRLDVVAEDYYELDVIEQGCTSASDDRWLAEFFLEDPTWSLEGTRLTLASGDTVIELERGQGAYSQEITTDVPGWRT